MTVLDLVDMKEHTGELTTCTDGWMTLTMPNRDSFSWHESSKAVVPMRLGPYSWPRIGNQKQAQ
jgi:hypothetical protein